MIDANTPAALATPVMADRRTGPNRRHAPDAGDMAAQLSIQVLGLALLEKQVTMLRAEVLKLKDVCRGCAGFSDHD